MSIVEVGQIAITVRDSNRAFDFYKNVLSLDEMYRYGDLSFFKCGNLRLFLTKDENNEQKSNIIYFRVENIKKSYDELVLKKVVFIDKPHIVAKVGNIENWMTFFYDSEGNTLALFEEIEV